MHPIIRSIGRSGGLSRRAEPVESSMKEADRVLGHYGSIGVEGSRASPARGLDGKLRTGRDGIGHDKENNLLSTFCRSTRRRRLDTWLRINRGARELVSRSRPVPGAHGLFVIKIRPPTLFVDSHAWIQVTTPPPARHSGGEGRRHAGALQPWPSATAESPSLGPQANLSAGCGRARRCSRRHSRAASSADAAR